MPRLAFVDDSPLRSRTTGRVLDLNQLGEASLVGALDALAESGQSYDSVVSVMTLVTVDDLEATLAAILRLLTDDGRLLFLEPARRTGFGSRAQALAGRATGFHLDRDIPDALRRNGYTICDIERFTMPTFLWYLREAVQGSAHRKLDHA